VQLLSCSGCADGMKGRDDPKFRERFTLMYDADGLQVPWYAVLGNHDYGDGGQNDSDFERCNGRTWEQCEALGCCPSPVWQVRCRQMTTAAQTGRQAPRGRPARPHAIKAAGRRRTAQRLPQPRH
jgi:hypothetical protein